MLIPLNENRDIDCTFVKSVWVPVNQINGYYRLKVELKDGASYIEEFEDRRDALIRKQKLVGLINEWRRKVQWIEYSNTWDPEKSWITTSH